MDKVAIKQYLTEGFQYTEAFKTLRTNLMFSGTDVRSVAITSCQPSEGKSTTSLHLAASLAESGKSVLLMDADLRRSQMAARLRLHGKFEGLTHFLSGMCNANEVIRETDIPGMYLLLAGAKVPHAAELLGSQNFVRLMTELKKTFDYVIIDSAPLGMVIDCAVMAAAVDGVLMVIDSTNNSAKLERQVKAQLEKVGARILGAVLTKVDVSDRRKYYGKDDHYSYSYGYSYDDFPKK